MGKVINFLKCQYWEKKWTAIVMCHFQTPRFSAIVWYGIYLKFIFSSGGQRTIVWETLGYRDSMRKPCRCRPTILNLLKSDCVCVCVFSNANPLHYYVLRVQHKVDRWRWVWSIFESRTAWADQITCGMSICIVYGRKLRLCDWSVTVCVVLLWNDDGREKVKPGAGS